MRLLTRQLNPTRFGIMTIALSVVAYIAALQAFTNLPLFGLSFLCALQVYNMWMAFRVAGQLKVKAPGDLRGIEGRNLVSSWEIHNPFNYGIGQIRLTSSLGKILEIQYLGPEEKVSLSPQLRLPKRGIYPFSKIQVGSSYPFGLWLSKTPIKLDEKLIVHPSSYPCEVPPASGFEPVVGGRLKSQNKSASGDQFSGVRPMVSSDSIRQVHWKTSAKGQGIMVKEFEEELAGRVGLIFLPQIKNKDSETFENAVRCCSSLMNATQEAGHQLDAIIAGRTNRIQVPPFSDGRDWLDELAAVQASKVGIDMESLLLDVNKLPSKSSICIVALHTPNSELDMIRSLFPKRKVAVYIPESVDNPTLSENVRVYFYNNKEIYRK
ncbi:MAG: DUF58 domain-containing protein [Lentisphaeria bacterium]|nr:DUF58 domain-containing protein [Lentisphaeria bacterium]